MIDANGTALLSDFALSTLVDEHGFPLFGQSELELGTVRWTAPESLTGENDNLKRNVPTKESDIYSFGGIMLQVRDGFFNLVSLVLKCIGAPCRSFPGEFPIITMNTTKTLCLHFPEGKPPNGPMTTA